jgi:hypothetical protein
VTVEPVVVAEFSRPAALPCVQRVYGVLPLLLSGHLRSRFAFPTPSVLRNRHQGCPHCSNLLRLGLDLRLRRLGCLRGGQNDPNRRFYSRWSLRGSGILECRVGHHNSAAKSHTKDQKRGSDPCEEDARARCHNHVSVTEDERTNLRICSGRLPESRSRPRGGYAPRQSCLTHVEAASGAVLFWPLRMLLSGLYRKRGNDFYYCYLRVGERGLGAGEWNAG